TLIDQQQLTQVFDNLTINAKQAMPSGGILKIIVNEVSIPEGTTLPIGAGRYVKIVFQDEGDGIPADILPRIFDPFFTTKKSGTGLGLSTVWSILNKHSGHIEVESTIGTGTCFDLYLPL
ncbi:MAG: histidine kinase, partial [Fibrobacteres bacterium]|nr:histidine kinase [Fibrobacterota bacterium]